MTTTTAHRSGAAPGWTRQDSAAGAWYTPTAPAQPQQTALARPVDVQSLAAAGIDANARIVRDILAGFAPSIDAEPTYQTAPAGISSREELHARNQRFRWTMIALVVLSAITAGGIVLIAIVAELVTATMGAALWIAASGVVAMAAAWHVHGTEVQHTPEAIARIDAGAGAYAAERRADAAYIIAGAYADAIRDDAAARRAGQENARAANLALASTPPPAPMRREMDYTPRGSAAPEAMTVYAQEIAYQPHQTTPAAPMADAPRPAASAAPRAAQDAAAGLVKMLATLDDLYASAAERDSETITLPLPWSARARANGWTQAEQRSAAAALAYFDPPLISRSADNGGRPRLNRQWRRPVARLIIARQWDRAE